MVVVAQLVRALDCGSRGRRFETGLPPKKTKLLNLRGFFCTTNHNLHSISIAQNVQKFDQKFDSSFTFLAS